jgi:hypothetical protein
MTRGRKYAKAVSRDAAFAVMESSSETRKEGGSPERRERQDRMIGKAPVARYALVRFRPVAAHKQILSMGETDTWKETVPRPIRCQRRRPGSYVRIIKYKRISMKPDRRSAVNRGIRRSYWGFSPPSIFCPASKTSHRYCRIAISRPGTLAHLP